MANSKIGNYRIEFEAIGYSNPTRQHAFGFWAVPDSAPDIGDPPTAINVRVRSGGTSTLAAAAQLHWDFARLLYDGAITVGSYTMWRYDTENARSFITAGDLSTPTGTGGGIQVANYINLSFRTAAGGIIKLLFPEPNQGGNNFNVLIPNAVGTAPQRVAAYVLSASSAVTGLDNTFPIAALRDSRGQNELYFREVFR